MVCCNSIFSSCTQEPRFLNLRVTDVGQINVGATDIGDKMSTFSNFGKVNSFYLKILNLKEMLNISPECVDVYGPGTSIVTASLDGKVGSQLFSSSFPTNGRLFR